MTSRVTSLATRGFIAASFAVFALAGIGCGSDDSPKLVGEFTASATPIAARLVKLVPQSQSGSRVVVQAVIYGPDTTLDMYSFAFDVKIGNPTVLGFVPNSAVAGPALQATGGQTISAIAGPDGADPSHIVVGVSKLGGGEGNGIGGTTEVVVSLAFDVLAEGTSTLAIAATPTPTVLDSQQPAQSIGSITFDTANGTVTAISTGGGGY